MQFNKPSNFSLLDRPPRYWFASGSAHPLLALLAMLAFYAYTAKIKEK